MYRNKLWFTADTHFGHAGIIGYGNRPFETVEVMDEALIKRWNDRVAPGDIVYHIGDFLFGKPEDWFRVLDRLNGQITLIEGNHDRNNSIKNNRVRKRFHEVMPFKEIQVPDPDAPGGKQRIVMCHYGLMTWRQRWYGAWMLHGHSHGSLERTLSCPKCGYEVSPECRRLDVGTDCFGYAPVSYQEVKQIMRTIDFTRHKGPEL